MAEQGKQKGKELPWIGVMFECCNAYRRIFKRADGTAYEGKCPRCRRSVRVRVGEGGSTNRIFRAR